MGDDEGVQMSSLDGEAKDEASKQQQQQQQQQQQPQEPDGKKETKEKTNKADDVEVAKVTENSTGKESDKDKAEGGGEGKTKVHKLESGRQADYVFVFARNKDEGDVGPVIPAEDPDPGCFGALRARRTKKKAERAKKARAKMTMKLRRAGLDVHQYLSRDEDEVMVSISATEEQVIKHASRMGVQKQLLPEYGGGYAPFDESHRQLFERYSDASFFRSGLRSSIVLNLIETPSARGGAGISVGKALNRGRLVGAFPLHTDEERKDLIEEWVKKFWKTQPLDMIRDYYGEKIALYFAYLGYYTRWLVLLSAIGLIPFFLGPGGGNGSKYDNLATPVYCFVLALWSTLYLEFWKRENAQLSFNWGVKDFEANERARPEFRGTERYGMYIDNAWVDLEAHHDRGEKVPRSLYYPAVRRWTKMGLGVPVITTAIGVVVAATIGVLMTRIILQNQTSNLYGGAMGGILMGATIAILDYVYTTVAFNLTIWENHRTETEFEDNLIGKTFLFQFVNSYLSLFYIAFFKGWRDGHINGDSCPDGLGCMGELSQQLLWILITRTVIGQFGELVYPVIAARVKVALEDRSLRKEGAAQEGVNRADVDVKKLTKIEQEAKMTVYPSTFQDYNEMIIQFGYVTLFAAAMPLASVIALINNIIEIRTDAVKLILGSQRPNYLTAQDIGTWYSILEIMSIASVTTNILVLCITSTKLTDWFSSSAADEQLNLAERRYKALLAGFIAEHVVLMLKFIIATLVPDVPGTVRKQLALQTYEANKAIGEEIVYYGDDDDDDADDDADSDAAFIMPDDIDSFEDGVEATVLKLGTFNSMMRTSTVNQNTV